VENASRKVAEDQEGFQLIATFQLLLYSESNLLGESIHLHNIKKNTEAVLGASKEVGLM
jgi:hypothetical protein